VHNIVTKLRQELRDPEYSEGYAESFLNSFVATQIKVIREQRDMTQAELAREIGTTQAGISRIENVNYSSWSFRTLIKLARAFHVRLKVSFEPYGTLPDEVVSFDRKNLERVKREEDPGLMPTEKSLVKPSARSRIYEDLFAYEQSVGNVIPITNGKRPAASVVTNFPTYAEEGMYATISGDPR
jgi:transcriptional regulator with XRE-family HTH domain